MIDETIYILTKLKISNGFEPLKKKKKSYNYWLILY